LLEQCPEAALAARLYLGAAGTAVAEEEQLLREGAFPSSRAVRKDEKLWLNGKHDMLCWAQDFISKENCSGCLKCPYSVLTTHPQLRARCQPMLLSLCPTERSIEPEAETCN